MAYDLYSERQKRARQEQDPYTYDEIPEGLRWQVFCVLKNLITEYERADVWSSTPNVMWTKFWNDVCQEKQLFSSPEGTPQVALYTYPYQRLLHHYQPEGTPQVALYTYLMQQAGVEDVLDIIEIAFQFIGDGKFYILGEEAPARPAYFQAINDMNTYFQRKSVGYQLVIGSRSGEVLITRIDSEFLHSETVVPALTLLREEGFDAAHKKFLSAHKHYRDGKHGDCITHANSAFESTMKTICDQRGWKYGRGTAKDLIGILHKNGLITGPSQKHLKQLADILESGLPLLRDQQSSAHGQGTNAAEPPAHTAAYALHLAAANILFLVQSTPAGKTASQGQ